MTKHCPICEDELYSDDAGIRVGQSYICESCFEQRAYGTLDENGKGNFDGAVDQIAMCCDWLFDKATVDIARAA